MEGGDEDELYDNVAPTVYDAPGTTVQAEQSRDTAAAGSSQRPAHDELGGTVEVKQEKLAEAGQGQPSEQPEAQEAAAAGEAAPKAPDADTEIPILNVEEAFHQIAALLRRPSDAAPGDVLVACRQQAASVVQLRGDLLTEQKKQIHHHVQVASMTAELLRLRELLAKTELESQPAFVHLRKLHCDYSVAREFTLMKEENSRLQRELQAAKDANIASRFVASSTQGRKLIQQLHNEEDAKLALSTALQGADEVATQLALKEKQVAALTEATRELEARNAALQTQCEQVVAHAVSLSKTNGEHGTLDAETLTGLAARSGPPWARPPADHRDSRSHMDRDRDYGGRGMYNDRPPGSRPPFHRDRDRDFRDGRDGDRFGGRPSGRRFLGPSDGDRRRHMDLRDGPDMGGHRGGGFQGHRKFRGDEKGGGGFRGPPGDGKSMMYRMGATPAYNGARQW